MAIIILGQVNYREPDRIPVLREWEPESGIRELYFHTTGAMIASSPAPDPTSISTFIFHVKHRWFISMGNIGIFLGPACV
jgi:hypothetical protein